MPDPIIVGFDSAWTDNVRAPGAVCAYRPSRDEFIAPRLARFDEAASFIETVSVAAAPLIIALDQPTRVPNTEGCRPVERVAGSLVNSLRGGVQPANRSKLAMFGPAAPVWGFLARLGAREAPMEVRTASDGRLLIEVFPALALPSIIPELLERGRAAKYNPAASAFMPADWPLVCLGVRRFALRLGASKVGDWLTVAGKLESPTKADQDMLDAVVCLLVALNARAGAPEATMVLGDLVNGYMVTPVTTSTRALLTRSAEARGVPVDAPGEAQVPPPARSSPALRPIPRPVTPRLSGPSAAGLVSRRRGATVRADELREMLIELARSGEIITYGEVARRFGHAWTQGFGASLKAALNELGGENRRRGEPLLMSLVVNKDTEMPGEGFFAEIGLAKAGFNERLAAHRGYVARCADFHW